MVLWLYCSSSRPCVSSSRNKYSLITMLASASITIMPTAYLLQVSTAIPIPRDWVQAGETLRAAALAVALVT